MREREREREMKEKLIIIQPHLRKSISKMKSQNIVDTWLIIGKRIAQQRLGEWGRGSWGFKNVRKTHRCKGTIIVVCVCVCICVFVCACMCVRERERSSEWMGKQTKNRKLPLKFKSAGIWVRKVCVLWSTWQSDDRKAYTRGNDVNVI